MPVSDTVMKFVAVAGLCIAPHLTLADDASDLTPEELRQIFEAQATRGLEIYPTDGGDTEAAEPEEVPKYTEITDGVTVDVNIAFDFDSAALNEDQKPKLSSLCEVMLGMSGTVFQIIGHTDASGSASYNQELSRLRAEEVQRYMIDDCGVPATRLQTIGVGEDDPLNTSNPNADENRRVEFQALG